MKKIGCLIVLLLTAANVRAQVVSPLTPALIEEAIAKGKKDYYWIDCAVVTTPYSRVVHEAKKARKEGRAFAAKDVTPSVLAPELHLYAFSDKWEDKRGGTQVANVQNLAVVPEGTRSDDAFADHVGALSPIRVAPLEPGSRKRLGLDSVEDPGRGRMAVYPIAPVLKRKTWAVVVLYDRDIPPDPGNSSGPYYGQPLPRPHPQCVGFLQPGKIR